MSEERRRLPPRMTAGGARRNQQSRRGSGLSLAANRKIVFAAVGLGALALLAVAAMTIDWGTLPEKLGFAGPHERLLVRGITVQNEFADALATVVDVATADAAAKRISALGDELGRINVEMEKLRSEKKLTKEEDERLREKYEPRIKAARDRAAAERDRISQIPDVAPILNDALFALREREHEVQREATERRKRDERSAPGYRPIEPGTPVAVGTRIQLHSVFGWENGTVRDVAADGRIKLHLDRHQSQEVFDQYYAREELRIPENPAPEPARGLPGGAPGGPYAASRSALPPAEKTARLLFEGEVDGAKFNELVPRIRALLGESAYCRTEIHNGVAVSTIAPVDDVAAFAKKIDFAKVLSVDAKARTIRVATPDKVRP